jgi:hypothetical protein
MAIEFPLASFPAGAFQAVLLGSDETGGPALGGPGQVVDWSAGGFWVAELSGMQLWEPDHFRLYRAMLMACRGGGEIDVPIIDDPQRPFPVDLAETTASLPFSDGTLFSDGSGFLGADLDYVVEESALEGDVLMSLRRTIGAPLRGGEYLTLIHAEAGPRAYCVETVTEENEDGVFQIAFGAGLREDVAAGLFADFQRPRCRMRLLTPWSEAWPRITAPFEAEVGLRFVESFAHL